MGEMIGRVALAIARARLGSSDEIAVAQAEIQEATAAVVAMMEPTHDMIVAAADLDLSDIKQVGGSDYWRTMLSAAINS